MTPPPSPRKAWFTRPARLAAIADQLEELAGELRKPGAAGILQAIADASEYQYPAATSGASAGGSGGGSLTPTEAKAANPDPTGKFAALVLVYLRQQQSSTSAILSAFRQWDPARSVAKCARCDHPIPRGYQRCQRVDPDTGVQCGSSGEHPRICRNPNCGRVMETGEYLRAGRCDPCRKHWDRHGVERIPVTALALGDTVIRNPTATRKGGEMRRDTD